MFGRRGSRDSDLTVVAQRRLAALAHEFVEARTGDAPGPASHSMSVSVRDASGAAAPQPLGRVGSTRPGRHVSPGGVRWWLTPHQVIVVALLVVMAMLAVAWWVLRSVPDPEPVQLTSERQLPSPAPTDPVPGAPSVSTPAGGAPDPTAAAVTATLVVDVTGKVRRPGIVELPTGSRVVDALKAAGGARPRADTAGLNLARLLVDGEQIVVGRRVPAFPGDDLTATPGGLSAQPSGTTPGAPAPVNLNLATQGDLEALPGIGPVTATAILAWRSEHGSFTSVDELLEVSGIGEATLAEITPYVHV